MGGAVGGDVPARLGPGHGVGAVGVDDAADFREGVVQGQVGPGVGGRVQRPLHLSAIQVHDHQVLRLQILVVHSRGLDDEEPLLPVDAADVAPGVGHQIPAGQLHIGLIYLDFQFLQHSVRSSCMFFQL